VVESPAVHGIEYSSSVLFIARISIYVRLIRIRFFLKQKQNLKYRFFGYDSRRTQRKNVIPEYLFTQVADGNGCWISNRVDVMD
jgi:hypothetical protein